MTHIIFALLFVAAMAGIGWNTRRLIGYLRTGLPQNRFANIGARVRNVLVVAIGQSKLMRDPVSGAIHAMIFWGFLALLAAVIESIIEGLIPGGNIAWLGPVYSAITISQDVFCVVILAGVLWAAWRRITGSVKRLKVEGHEKADAMLILGLIGVIVVALLLANAARAGSGHEFAWAVRPVGALLHPLIGAGSGAGLLFHIAWWAHIVTILGFMNYLPYSKHLHVLSSIPNVYFGSLETVNKLQKINFEDESLTQYGVSDIEHFTWKQLLDGMTCTHCGRCTSVCPANITGKALDPKDIIIKIHDRTMDKAPVLAANSQPDQSPADSKKLIGDYVSSQALWQCTTCMACVQECPVMIEHVPAIVDMRRSLVMMESDFPAEVQPVFGNIETNGTPWAFSQSERADWAQGTPTRTMADATETERRELDVLFWVGCAGSYDDRAKKTTQAFAELMDIAGVNYRILGTEESCTGDPARRLGNEYLAQMMIQQNVETLNNYDIKKIVTSCPHCLNTLKNEYPDFGGNYQVVHHTQLIQDMVKEGRLKTGGLPAATVTYHDSCYLGRYNDVYQAPRALLENVPGLNVVEMPRNQSRGLCCGAGGGQMFMEETQGKRVNMERTEEAVATNATTIAAACPFCMTMMTDGVKALDKADTVQVKDIAEIVLDAVKNN